MRGPRERLTWTTTLEVCPGWGGGDQQCLCSEEAWGRATSAGWGETQRPGTPAWGSWLCTRAEGAWKVAELGADTQHEYPEVVPAPDPLRNGDLDSEMGGCSNHMARARAQAGPQARALQKVVGVVGVVR